MALNVAVIYGGKSAEHEVSVHSAETIGKCLNKDKYNIFPIFIDRQGRWFLQKNCGETSSNTISIVPMVYGGYNFVSHSLSKKKFAVNIDVVFPCLHGPMGEDGSIQGLFEQMGVAYAGCNVLASSLGMDKDLCKLIAKDSNIPAPKHIVIDKKEKYEIKKISAWCKKTGFPVFVKPLYLGSSVGISKVSSLKKLNIAIKKAFKFDIKIMVEKGIDNAREITCAVLGSESSARASVCGEVKVFNHSFYDYDAKYIDPNGSKLVIPAEISPNVSANIRKMSVKLFKALRCSGLARVDFLLDKKENFYFCEINTIPGFTSHSLYPRLWESTGISFEHVLDELIAIALERKKAQSKLSLVL